MRHKIKVLLLEMHGMVLNISAKLKAGNLAQVLLFPEEGSSFLTRVHLDDTFNPYDPKYLLVIHYWPVLITVFSQVVLHT